MTPELVASTHCGTGENPLWDERRQLLFWCDVPTGQIFAYSPASGTHRQIADLKRECGAFTLEESGDLLLLFVGEAALLNPDTGEIKPLKKDFLRDTERFNDCIALPDGSVLAGTVDWSKKTRGGLFHLHEGFKNHRLTSGSECSNGLGWTLDGRGLYWIDSTARKIWKFAFDPQTCEATHPVLWLHAPEATPDGMTTDANGDLWVAFFDGPYIRHYDANAHLIEQIDFPTKSVTSCIFGGANMDELYVTTGGGQLSDTPDNPSGALFRLKPDVSGKQEYRSKLGEL